VHGRTLVVEQAPLSLPPGGRLHRPKRRCGSEVHVPASVRRLRHLQANKAERSDGARLSPGLDVVGGKDGLLAQARPSNGHDRIRHGCTRRQGRIPIGGDKRLAVTPSDSVDASQRAGATMASGWMSWARSTPDSRGTMGVFAAPPGIRTLAVTPVSAKSPARTAVWASRAAFEPA
jgi:hypothetical protein